MSSKSEPVLVPLALLLSQSLEEPGEKWPWRQKSMAAGSCKSLCSLKGDLIRAPSWPPQCGWFGLVVVVVVVEVVRFG